MRVLFILLCLLNTCCIQGAKNDTIVTNSFLLYPNYRASILVGNEDPWEILFEFSPKYKGRTFVVTQKLTTYKGKVLETKTNRITLAEDSQYLLKQAFRNKPDIGVYLWNISFEGTSGEKYNYSTKINVLEEYPQVYVGKDGFLRIDNVKFFPFGIYTGDPSFRALDNVGAGKSSFDDLKRMKDAGYNTVLSYFYGSNEKERGKLFLEDAYKNDIKVIYSVKDFVKNFSKNQDLIQNIVSDLEDQSSLLAWYTNDEMQIYKTLDSVYNDIVELDRNHPVFQVTNMLNLLDNFYHSTDIIATDPYPIGDRFKSRNTLDNVTVATEKTIESSRGAKGAWEVLQFHNLDFLNKDKTASIKPPTIEQMKNMSYQALVNGTKGLLFFAYHWLYFDRDESGKIILSDEAFEKRWVDVLALNQEIKPLTNIILANDIYDITLIHGSKNSYKAWRDNNLLYLVVVNNSDKEEQILSFKMPSGWRLKENNALNTKINQNNDTFTITLSPVASGVIILEQ